MELVSINMSSDKDLVVLAFYGCVSELNMTPTARVMLRQRKYHSPMEGWYDGDGLIWRPLVHHPVFSPWTILPEKYKGHTNKLWKCVVLPDKRHAWVKSDATVYRLQLVQCKDPERYKVSTTFTKDKVWMIRIHMYNNCQYVLWSRSWDILPLFYIFTDSEFCDVNEYDWGHYNRTTEKLIIETKTATQYSRRKKYPPITEFEEKQAFYDLCLGRTL